MRRRQHDVEEGRQVTIKGKHLVADAAGDVSFKAAKNMIFKARKIVEN